MIKWIIAFLLALPVLAAADPLQDCHVLTTSPEIEQCYLHNLDNHGTVIRAFQKDIAFDPPSLNVSRTAGTGAAFNWFYSGNAGDYEICWMEFRRETATAGTTVLNIGRNVVAGLNVAFHNQTTFTSPVDAYTLAMVCSTSPPTSGCDLNGSVPCVASTELSIQEYRAGAGLITLEGMPPD